jgi:hypothetical protein
MEQLFEDPKSSIEALHLQMRSQIKRDLQTVGERTIAKIRPILEELERRRQK